MPRTKENAQASTFKPVHVHRSFDLVCESVREKLIQGELKPGDKLPAERDLAVQLGVSRNVVREALRGLEIAGIVALRKGAKGGAFIQQGEAGRMAHALNDLITLNTISPQDLCDARIMILEMVIDRVCANGAQPDTSKLEAVLDETRAAVADGDELARIELAREFYHELAALTGNSAIIFTVDSQTEVVQTFLRYRVGNMPEQTLIESRELFLSLLKKGDVSGAKAELRAHLTRVHTSLW